MVETNGSAYTVFAQNAAHAGALLHQAYAAGHSVFPCGQRSRQARVLPHVATDCWLSMADCREMLWLDVADQTCEVQAGMSPAALITHLEGTGLELAVMCRNHNSGTLGGLFMAAEASLLGPSCGLTRDFVLGASWVLADGSSVRSGARVVKSVAGYDVTRLLLGSRGQLAINTSLILRLRPAPRELFWFQIGAAEWLRLQTELAPSRLVFPAEAAGQIIALFANFAPQHPALSPLDAVEGERQRLRYLEQMTAPVPPASSWLEATAEACAPGAPHFGRRP